MNRLKYIRLKCKLCSLDLTMGQYVQKIFIFVLLLFSPITWAKERVALVIGNTAYETAPILPNAINDAQDIADTLDKLDFKVELKKNLNRKQMAKAISVFGEKLEKDTIGLFYYAGHALQVGGKNYLLPLDAMINKPDEVHYESIDIDRILTKMASNDLNIIILDACRDHPFKKSDGFQGSSGLASIDAPEGFLIVYATTPGKGSVDGQGKNGLFTKHLLKNIIKPNINIISMLTTTRKEVIEESKTLGYKQVPWESSSLLTPFCFVSCPPKQPKPPIPPISPISPTKPKPTSSRLSFEPEMVQITGGSFKMGCNSKICEDDETPPHSVTIAPFYIGKYEVTFAQWDACVKAKGCFYQPDDNGWGRGKHPVINVSWYDTQEFIKWLRTMTGKDYRLPTEAEWEYATRIKTKTTYPWGNTIGDNHANCDGCGSSWDNKSTAPVGSFSAYYGLYDMQGNVWEWVQDCYHKNYDNALMNSAAWDTKCDKNSTGEISAVLRGGSWSSSPNTLRSTHRFFNHLDRRPSTYGFRIAKSK